MKTQRIKTWLLVTIAALCTLTLGIPLSNADTFMWTHPVQEQVLIEAGHWETEQVQTAPGYWTTQQVQTGTQQIQTGTHQVQVGTQQVQTGTEQVQTGTQTVQTGTQSIQVQTGTTTERVQTGTHQVQTGSQQVQTGTQQVVIGVQQVCTTSTVVTNHSTYHVGYWVDQWDRNRHPWVCMGSFHGNPPGCGYWVSSYYGPPYYNTYENVTTCVEEPTYATEPVYTMVPIYTTEPVYEWQTVPVYTTETVPVYSTVPVYTSEPIYSTVPIYQSDPVYTVVPVYTSEPLWVAPTYKAEQVWVAPVYQTQTVVVQTPVQPPTASFTISPSQIASDMDQLTFQVASSDPQSYPITIEKWVVIGPNGTTTSSTAPTTLMPGQYEISLSVQDQLPDGMGGPWSNSYTQDLTVNPSMTAQLNGASIVNIVHPLTSITLPQPLPVTSTIDIHSGYNITMHVNSSEVGTLRVQLFSGGAPIQVIQSDGTTVEEASYQMRDGGGDITFAIPSDVPKGSIVDVKLMLKCTDPAGYQTSAVLTAPNTFHISGSSYDDVMINRTE